MWYYCLATVDARANGLRQREWACGAAGSASAWHAEGQGFEPPQVHHDGSACHNNVGAFLFCPARLVAPIHACVMTRLRLCARRATSNWLDPLFDVWANDQHRHAGSDGPSGSAAPAGQSSEPSSGGLSTGHPHDLSDIRRTLARIRPAVIASRAPVCVRAGYTLDGRAQSKYAQR